MEAGEREAAAAMSVGGRKDARRRTATERLQTADISTTSTSADWHSAQSIGTSTATIVLGDSDDDGGGRGSEDSCRPSGGVDSPSMIITPPPDFRSSVCLTEDDHRQRQQQQQQASSPTGKAPVPVPRRLKDNKRQSHPAKVDETQRVQVEDSVRNGVKGQGHRRNNRRRNDSGSSDDRRNNRDDHRVGDTKELTDNDNNGSVVVDAAGTLSLSPTSSSSSKPADNDINAKSASYPVRWIGSAPLGGQLRDKQRSETIFGLTGNLSAAAESLGRVSYLCHYTITETCILLDYFASGITAYMHAIGSGPILSPTSVFDIQLTLGVGYNYDSILVRRTFDFLSVVIEVTVT